MRIAIDISSAVKPERTGMANSIINLVKAISEVDRENDYALCCRLSRLKNYHYLPRIDKHNFRLKIIQEPFNLFFPKQIDIFHSGGTRLPAYRIARTIVTIPDVLLLLSDEYATKEYREKNSSGITSQPGGQPASRRSQTFPGRRSLNTSRSQRRRLT
jgi:hypothetical protein